MERRKRAASVHACVALAALALLLASTPAGARIGARALRQSSEGPSVFTNGAWSPSKPGYNLNAYVAAVISKDMYFRHILDPTASPQLLGDFGLFNTIFCRHMNRLGADDCEAVNGGMDVVWAVIRAGNSVLVAFRGSNTPQNWIADASSFATVNVPDFGGGSSGTDVAAGFYQAFAANRDAIVDKVGAAMAKAAGAGGGGPRLWVFGHSLGGAVALMAAAYLDKQKGLTATGVYTFGSPRVGGARWAQMYPLGGVTVRVENTGDVVPLLPPGPNFRHVGSAKVIQRCDGQQEPVTIPDLPDLVSRLVSGDLQGAAESVVKAVDSATGIARTVTGQLGSLLPVGVAGGIQVPVVVVPAGAPPTAIGAGISSTEGLTTFVTDDGRTLRFPTPIALTEHFPERYVVVMWTCLSESQKKLVPGPQDVYYRP